MRWPPEGAARLRPGKAGSAAHAGLKNSGGITSGGRGAGFARPQAPPLRGGNRLHAV